MEDDSRNIKFMRPLFKKPWRWIIICAAIAVYFYLFHVRILHEPFGLIAPSPFSKLFASTLFSVFAFFTVFGSPFAQKIESRLLRFAVALGAIALLMALLTSFTGRVHRFDHEKLNTYHRVLPFGNALSIRTHTTLCYRDIQFVRRRPGPSGEGPGSIGLELKGGGRRDVGFSTVSRRTRNTFLLTLYRECEWLRESIVREFGPIEQRIRYLEREAAGPGLRHFHLAGFMFKGFLIWVLFTFFAGMVLYVLKIDKRYKDQEYANYVEWAA